MALSISNGLSFSDIQDEFEPNRPVANISLGSYRLSDSVGIRDVNGDATPLYTASPSLPSSGTIKVSDFNGAKKTIVIRYNYQGTDSITYTGRTLSRDFQRLDPQSTWVPQDLPGNIGSGVTNAYGTGFTIYKITPTPDQRNLLPSNLDNALDARVIISIGGSLGSKNVSKTNCALYLDSGFKVQDAANNIIVETENGSLISGSGGRGGTGGNGISTTARVGLVGNDGSSAVGIGTSIFLFKNRGLIQAGQGGGGGGYSVYKATGRTSTAVGGGGGGGAGIPGGIGGSPGVSPAPVGSTGVQGQKFIGGAGGTGVTQGSDVGGAGGQGGSSNPLSAASAGSLSSDLLILTTTNNTSPVGFNTIYLPTSDWNNVDVGFYVINSSAPTGTTVTNKAGSGSNRYVTLSNNLTSTIPSSTSVTFSSLSGGSPGGNPGYAIVVAPNTPTPTITNLVAGASQIGITTINTLPTT